MDKSSAKFYCLGLVLTSIALICCIHTADADIGACYGTLGNNLPSPREMIALCKQHNINRIRIFNPNPTILEALQGSNISVIVGVENLEIPAIAKDPSLAKTWVQNNILKYRNINFRCIAVGNEITPTEGDPSAFIAPSVPIAMQHISDALAAVRRRRRIKVSTVLSMAIMGQSYPPSSGEFKSSFRDSFMNPIVQFLTKTKNPFLINVYPFFPYSGDTTNIRLDYALFTAPSAVVKDGEYQYYNLFDAMLDSVHAALDKAGGGNLEVVVTETGWPSAGATGATVANAGTYNSNLLKSVQKGTPRKPGKPIETYIFDVIDENEKSPELEKHWGLFLADKSPKYPLS